MHRSPDVSQEHGYFKLSRKGFRDIEAGGCPLWNEKRELSRWEAWIYLIQAASHTAHEYTPRGVRPLALVRGETRPLSIRYLMQVWGWGSKKRVSAFLEQLITWDRIRVQQRTPNGDTYVVVNYDTYQDGGDSSGDRDGDSSGDKGEVRRKENEVKKEGKPARARREKKTEVPLPAEWAPNDQHRTKAAELGLDVEWEAEQFRDRHTALGSLFVDWDAAFRTWLRNAPKFNRGGPAQLTVLQGGAQEDREAKDREAQERRRQEQQQHLDAFNNWREEVSRRFAALPAERREQWKEKVRPEMVGLERFPERHKRALKQRVYEAYGESVGLPMPMQEGAA